ncbi:AAA family ATPase [Runella sp.]|uniref:AAA family ATPase n=1 Tax=Runella sp. TaxID=1960881 RepID=UPI003D11466A
MLQRIHIENFKSLKNVTLDLQRVNVLIGPNNSGKTNLLKALELLKMSAGTPFQVPIDNSFFFKKLEGELILEAHLVDTQKVDDIISVQYVLSNNVLSGKTTFSTYKEKTDKIKASSILESFLRTAMIYEPQLKFFTLPGSLEGNTATLESDLSNIISFLDVLRDQFLENYIRIEKSLNICIPEFSGLRFGKIVAKDFASKEMVSKKLGLYHFNHNVIYWADELSEGVLYFLALLCIIHQPNPPKLLLLEEPERGIHPRRIKEVIGFIKQLAYEKDIQVIMTTHSPLVLDEFSETPESVFIFDKDAEGATSIKNLQKDVIEPENAERTKKNMEPVNYTDALGENWTIGFLGGVPK